MRWFSVTASTSVDEAVRGGPVGSPARADLVKPWTRLGDCRGPAVRVALTAVPVSHGCSSERNHPGDRQAHGPKRGNPQAC